MRKGVFKNENARQRQLQWYQFFLERTGVQTESFTVPTSAGDNHVLCAGDQQNSPLVCLHSMLTSSAHLLSEIDKLSRSFYLIIPDIPGQSVKAPEHRLPLDSASYSNWLQEILDYFELSSFHMMGVSLGGYIARRYTELQPDRVKKLILIVPAGIVQAPVLKGLLKMAGPMIRFKINPSEKNLKRFTDPLLSTWDEDWAKYLADSFNDFKTMREIPPVASDEQLQKLTMPLLLVASEEDISFPGKPLIERIQSQVPSAVTELLKGARHCPPTTDAFRDWLSQKITLFLNS